MKVLAFPVALLLLLIYIRSSHEQGHKNVNVAVTSGSGRRIDFTKLNPKAVGLVLKANGKQYFVSSELCPGGVFLTKPVNENCLCYNGIFQIVRHCCSPGSNTQLNSDNLEWRMDYKCGSSSPQGSDGESMNKAKPIRAILPLSKPHSRFSSIVLIPSLTGNGTSKWRKFDMDDIIIRNDAQLSLDGRSEFEIVNFKPLGREVKIFMGNKSTEVAVCFRGWLTSDQGQGHQNLRVKLVKAGATLTSGNDDCCLNVTEDNSPGEIGADCTSAIITTEVVNVQSTNEDIGQCDQDVTGESDSDRRTLRKREQPKFQTIRFKRGPNSPTFSFTRELPISSYQKLTGGDHDLIPDKGSVLIKREGFSPESMIIQPDFKMLESNEEDDEDDSDESPVPGPSTSKPGTATTLPPMPVIIPRKKGISRASFREQAQAINEFIAIIRNDLSVEIKEPETFRFQLLKKSFDIFLSVVPNEIVPQILVKTAFDVFYYLFEELDPVLERPPGIFKSAMKYLDNCMNVEGMLNLTTFGCPPEVDNLVIDSVTLKKLQTYYAGQDDELQSILKSLQRIQLRRDRRFIPERNDIYVEINWKVVDFVHSFCFDHFSEEYNAHQFYESEVEKLFLFPEVQKRWFGRYKDLRYVRGIFPVSDLNLRMKQLDKVSAIGHYLSRYNGSYWLFRPSISSNHLQEDGFNMESTAVHKEKRLVFAQNMMEQAAYLAGDRNGQGSGGAVSKMESTERGIMYPFQFPEKLPAGELIWDGLAICLHAGYSNRRSYFVDSKLWGVKPSLLDLGKLYP